MIPDAILSIAFAWASLLLVAGGLLLLRARDSLHRLLVLDVLGTIVIIMLATLSYLDRVSYYIDAGLAVSTALLTVRVAVTGRNGV